MTTVETTHYCIGSVMGPHPFPVMVRDFQRVIGVEAREQVLAAAGRLPDAVIACVGGGSNAIGAFHAFIPDDGVALIGCEAGGDGLATGRHAATLAGGSAGVIHGMRTFLLQDADGQTLETHSISAGLDYPGVGPEHAWLHDTGRASYRAVTDAEAMDAFSVLCRTEGIIPAIESAHALAGALQLGPELGPDAVLLVNLSGRGDKDVDIAARWFGHLGGAPVTTPDGNAVARDRRRDAFEAAAAQDRAALVGYLPAGFPSVDGAIAAAIAMAEAGADIIEIGLPYSDPLMDGPVIQEAVHRALAGGTRVADVLRTVEAVAGAGVPTLVMTYWNPVDHHGVDAFAARPGRGRRQRADHPRPDAGGGRAVAGRGRGPWPRPGLPGRAELVRRADQADHLGLRRVRLRGLADGHHRHQGRGRQPGGRAWSRRVRECTTLPVAVGLGVRDGRQAAAGGRLRRRGHRGLGVRPAAAGRARTSGPAWPACATSPPSWPPACATAAEPWRGRSEPGPGMIEAMRV